MKKKTVIRLIVQLLIVILLLEILLRIVFYQQTGRDRFALTEIARRIKRKIIPQREDQDRVYKDFLLARPDSSNEVNKQIVQEAIASNHFEYAPWAEYKNIDFSGRYISTRGFTRTTTPDSDLSSDSMQLKKIYFFGGSTMYGVNITDRETIAAAFVSIYKQQFPQGISIRVVNYGIPAYHSYNELMLLSHLIYSNQQPGIAIMLDGLNDFLMPDAVLNRRPYFYYRLRQASKDNINLKELENINDSTASLFNNPAGYSEDALADTLARNYLSNIDRFKKLAAANNFDAFFFIQPNPFYHYPNKKNDPICDKQQYPLVEKGYGILEKSSIGITHCFFLGNMLAHEQGYPFIDRFHYSPSMCQAIAKELVAVVGPEINKH